MMAVRPSRMSSPARFGSFSLRRPLALAYLLTTVVSAARKPSSWVPPSMVAMPLAKRVEAVGLVAVFHWNASSTSWSSSICSKYPTFENSGLLRRVDVLDEVDDAAGVPVDDRLVVVLGALVLEADLEALVEERHHLEALEQRAGDELGDLEDDRVGPERDGGAGAAPRARCRPPRAWSSSCRRRRTRCGGACRRGRPRRSTLLDRALTTDTPTPWRPPDTL